MPEELRQAGIEDQRRIVAVPIYRMMAEQEEERRRMMADQERDLQDLDELQAEPERRIHALQLADIDNMPVLDVEDYIRCLLEHRGFTATVTRASNDFGGDIVAEQDDREYAIQVKRQASGVSRQAVSDAVAGMDHYACDRAMVITNNYFTEGAKELARSNHCELVDRDVLAEWILEFQEEGDAALVDACADVPGHQERST